MRIVALAPLMTRIGIITKLANVDIIASTKRRARRGRYEDFLNEYIPNWLLFASTSIYNIETNQMRCKKLQLRMALLTYKLQRF